jgi:hypothetical protein
MAIDFVALPAPARDVVVAFASRVPGVTAIVLGHELYQLGLDDLAAGARLDAAKRVAIRFVVESGETAISIIDATVPTQNGALSILGLLGAAPARELYAAAGSIDESRFGDRTYTFRVLQVPALSVTCIWLHARDADLLLPYGGALASSTRTLLTPQALFKAIAPIARKRMEAETELEEGATDEAKRSPINRRAAGTDGRGKRTKRNPRPDADTRVLRRRPRQGK